jgi:hypothetical protein
MRFDDLVRYLEEVRRVLKKQGAFLCTYLLLNDRSLQAIANKKAHFILIHKAGEHSLTFDEKCPKEGIGHDEKEVMRLYNDLGFKVSRIEYGTWPENFTVDLQDVIIAAKSNKRGHLHRWPLRKIQIPCLTSCCPQ